MFYHSLRSDWNHGNAHFLRGVAVELLRRNNEVRVYEPEDGWSLRNLLAEQGSPALEGFRRAYPTLTSRFYELREFFLEPVAHDGREAREHLARVLSDPDLAAELSARGCAAIADRHTCDHRAALVEDILDGRARSQRPA